MFFGINTGSQKFAVYPQPLSALLFSSCRNCWSGDTEICHSLFPHLISAGKGGEAVMCFVFFCFLLSSAMMLTSKWTGGLIWQA